MLANASTVLSTHMRIFSCDSHSPVQKSVVLAFHTRDLRLKSMDTKGTELGLSPNGGRKAVQVAL